MANEVTSLKCRDKKYYISQSGEDVYFSSSNPHGGLKLYGIRYKNNELQRTSDYQRASEYEICQAIVKSLK